MHSYEILDILLLIHLILILILIWFRFNFNFKLLPFNFYIIQYKEDTIWAEDNYRMHHTE